MTSSQYGPYGQGCTRTTMPGTEGSKTVKWSKSPKTGSPGRSGGFEISNLKFEIPGSGSLIAQLGFLRACSLTHGKWKRSDSRARIYDLRFTRTKPTNPKS